MAKPGIRAEIVSSEWLTAHDTLERVSARIGNRQVAVSALVNRIKAGLIQTAAMRSRWRNGVYPDAEKPTLIPRDHWTFFPAFQTAEELAFWQTGDIRFDMEELTTTFDVVMVTYFGVRFDPDGVEEMIASAAPTRQRMTGYPAPMPLDITAREPAEAPINKGGRPRKEWWDDFWIDICGLIYEGKLNPKTQAELERAMLEWVENHGHDVGDTTIKKAAKKLFNAWGLRGSKT
jgi:hypothetical protein